MSFDEYRQLDQVFRYTFGEMFVSCHFESNSGMVQAVSSTGSVAFQAHPISHVVTLQLFIPKLYQENWRKMIDFGYPYSSAHYSYNENNEYLGYMMHIVYKTHDLVEFAKTVEKVNWERWDDKISADIDKVINDD